MKSRFLLTAAVCAFTAIAVPAIAAEATNTTDATAAGNAAGTVDASNGTVKGTVDANLSGSANSTTKTDAAGTSTSTGANANAMASNGAAITIDTIDTSAPFGDIKVDPTMTLAQIDSGLSADQKVELQDRCQVVVQNEGKFDTSFPVWCKDYLSFRAKATAQ